jgi:acetylcholinesterase
VEEFSMPVPEWYFLPVVDGNLIHDHLYNLFSEGKFLHTSDLLLALYANSVPSFVSSPTNKGTWRNFPSLNLSHDQLEAINRAYEDAKPLPKHAAYFASAAGAYGVLLALYANSVPSFVSSPTNKGTWRNFPSLNRL